MTSGTTNDDNPSLIPPIKKEERLYRRVLNGGWYKPGRPNPIPYKCFMPRPWVSDDRRGDYNGISINRALLIDLKTAAKRPDNGQTVHVAEFGVSDVLELGLTVKPDPQPNDRSHALIPELNSMDQRDPNIEKRMVEWVDILRIRAKLVYEAPQ